MEWDKKTKTCRINRSWWISIIRIIVNILTWITKKLSISPMNRPTISWFILNCNTGKLISLESFQHQKSLSPIVLPSFVATIQVFSATSLFVSPLWCNTNICFLTITFIIGIMSWIKFILARVMVTWNSNIVPWLYNRTVRQTLSAAL